MKILLSNHSLFEITDEILTIEEFLTLAERLKDITIVSRNFGQQFVPQSQPQPVEVQEQEVQEEEQQPQQDDMSELPIEERVYRLKLQGNSLSQIGKAFNMTTSQARRLYARVYQREWMRKNKNGKSKSAKQLKLTKSGKPRKRASVQARWSDRNEVLEVLKTHYFGTQQDKQAFERRKGKAWNDIVKSLWNLTKRYKIKPSELGLTRWGKPTRSDKGVPKKQVQVQIQPQSQIQSQQPQEHQESLNIAERQFVEFFNNYMQKGGFEDELKQATLLLREWLRSQGKSGNVQDVLTFLGTRIKSLKPIVPPEKLEEWFK